VTLEKAEKEYSATIRYDDYPISPTKLYWESQSVTRADSPTGRRYVNHEREGKPCPAVRAAEEEGRPRRGAALLLPRPVTDSRHAGERSMRIVWRLRHPMPAELFQEAKVVGDESSSEGFGAGVVPMRGRADK